MKEYCDATSYQVIRCPDEELIKKMDFINLFAEFVIKHLSKMERAAFIHWFSGSNAICSFPFKSEEQKKRAAIRAKRRFKRYYHDFYN